MRQAYRTVVDVMSGTRDLTTLASVKLELGITDNSQDAWISEQIHQVSQQFATMCNRNFSQETLIDYFDVPCRDSSPLVLSRIPVTGILEINEGDAVVSLDGVEFDEESGTVYRRVPGTRLLNSNWFGGFFGTVSIKFIGGYQLLATLPYDIEHACNLMMKTRIYSKGRDPTVRSESIPGVMSLTYGSASTSEGDDSSEVSRLASLYRVPAIA